MRRLPMSARTGAGPVRPPQPTQVAGVCFMIACRALARPPGLRRHSQAPSGAALSSTGNRFATTTSELWRITTGYFMATERDREGGRSDARAVVEVVVVLVTGPQPPHECHCAADDRREADERHEVGVDGQQGGPQEQDEAEDDAEGAGDRVLGEAGQ